MKPETINLASGVVFGIYSLSVLAFTRNLLKDTQKMSLLWAAFFAAVNGFLFGFLVSIHISIPDMHIVLIIVFALEFWIVFKTKKYMIYWGTMHLMLNIIFARGFVSSLLALSQGETLSTIMLTTDLRFTSLLLSVLVLYVVMIIFHFTCPKEKMHVFFSQKKQVNSVNLLGSVMLIYLLLCSRTFYYNIDTNLFAVLQLSACVLIAIAYYSIFNSSLESSVWITETWKYIILEKQLERQLLHYRSYESTAKAIKIFKHDYTKMFSGVQKLLQSKHKDEALEMLEDMEHMLQNDTPVHRALSNNLLIDAVLHELENKCLEHNIIFESSVFAPKWIALSAIEFSAIFSALSEISVSCCVLNPCAKNHINLFASHHETWFTISVEFSCANKDGLQQIKAQKATVEYTIIQDIAAIYNGFCEFDHIENSNTAKISVHLNCNIKSEGVI